MKKIILFALLITLVLTGFSQKKSKDVPAPNPCDSLLTANKNLTLTVDSLSLELVKYKGVYTTIKEKVLYYEFDPARTAYIIDSLKMARDSATATLFTKQKSIQNTDSILSISTDGKRQISAQDIERMRAIDNLRKLKELLDANIITEGEYVTLKEKYLKYL